MSSHRIGYVIMLLLGIAAGLVISHSFERKTAGEAQSHTDSESSVSAMPHVETLVVAGRKIVSGPAEISITQGETLSIVITSDEDEEIHVHGYNKMIELEKGKTVTLTFVADTAGRFHFELERSGKELGVIIVNPK